MNVHRIISTNKRQVCQSTPNIQSILDNFSPFTTSSSTDSAQQTASPPRRPPSEFNGPKSWSEPVQAIPKTKEVSASSQHPCPLRHAGVCTNLREGEGGVQHSGKAEAARRLSGPSKHEVPLPLLSFPLSSPYLSLLCSPLFCLPVRAGGLQGVFDCAPSLFFFGHQEEAAMQNNGQCRLLWTT